MLGIDMGIDLGTASVLVYVKNRGVVLKEPSVVAFDRDTNKIKAIGEEARLMLGRTPGNIIAVRPLRQGVISDYTVTQEILFSVQWENSVSVNRESVSVCQVALQRLRSMRLRKLLIIPEQERLRLLRSRLQQPLVQELISPNHVVT